MSINEHEGKKYLREIHDARLNEHQSVMVDVYEVLIAFEVICPARQHAIKKLLCAGQRLKGDVASDLAGALAAVNRAIELERRFETSQRAVYGEEY